jgi:tetratricopeptide (TPR) repeat protein
MKSFLHLLLISLMVLTTGYGALECRAQGYSADEYKSDIRAALGADDYSKAIEICENAIKEHPNDADFFYYEGFALAESKQFDKAMEAYKEGISIHVDKRTVIDFKNTNTLNIYREGLAFSSKNPDLAIKKFLEAQSLEPDNPMGFYNAAATYLIFKKDTEKAREYGKKALGVKPDYINAINLFGNSYFKENKCPETSFYLNLVLRINPNHTDKDILSKRINECQ